MFNEDYTCGTCWKAFPAGWRARDNHCNATGHSHPQYECDTCERYFGSEDARFRHMNAKNHFAHECSICDETWPDQAQLKTHEIEEHYYCQKCDRSFMNFNNIQQQGFVTATGAAHHIETGACPNAPQVGRDELYRFIRGKDPHGIITKKLIGWSGSATWTATSRTWNGWAYECYFCHREFSELSSLQQHLNSPVHQQKLYHCPGVNCRKDFLTLAAVINHLESESCGYMRFDHVQRKFGNIVAPGKRLAF